MAHVLIIELPGGNDVDVVEAALDRGDKFTFLTAQFELYRAQPEVLAALDQACEVIEVPGFSYAEVEPQVLRAHARRPFDAVICLIDIRIIEAARLAQRLGLRHLSHSSATLLRDKYNVRQRLQQSGIPQPPFALAQTNEQLQEAVARLGLPVLIKPADGYGSQNIVCLKIEEDLAPRITPLNAMLPSHADYGLGVLANDRILVERYLSGTFIGCDTMTIDGHHTLLGINEKLMFPAPLFAMRGSTFIPNHAGFAGIERYAFDLLDAVKFDQGLAHIEMMLTSEGPQLVEINPRLVGAKIARMVSYSIGHSVHQDLIALHLGELPRPVNVNQQCVSTVRWIVSNASGRLSRVELPGWSDPRIRCVELLKKPGDMVRPPFENADRIGYVVACAANRQEAEQLAGDFVAETRLHVERDAVVPHDQTSAELV